MGADAPKQFLPLAGRPVLMRTLERLHEALPEARLVVSLPEEQFDVWKELCHDHRFEIGHVLVAGGAERFDSVLAALERCGDCDLIAVHDGVRPLVSVEMIRRVVAQAEQHGSAVPVIAPVDSLRMVEGESSRPVDRACMRAVQTPQAFGAGMLRESYRRAQGQGGGRFTDDGTVVESAGHTIHLCPGEERNIKITKPIDMIVARALLGEEQAADGEGLPRKG
ncbi:2-C-methyl-D-erythritol 4-phosphate cytidylyltransferase [Bacteroidia bacterium]|nr:2-C-methyl-D-erythritol 4-phosphate cytidylyltransferase [Bacteroidia bacterium]